MCFATTIQANVLINATAVVNCETSNIYDEECRYELQHTDYYLQSLYEP